MHKLAPDIFIAIKELVRKNNVFNLFPGAILAEIFGCFNWSILLEIGWTSQSSKKEIIALNL